MNYRSSHRDGFRKYVLFFQKQPFYNFPGGCNCSSNRHVFFTRVYIMFFGQTRIFQEGFSNRHVFQGGSIGSSNRSYYLIEQILIFQETLSSPQTHIIFQDTRLEQKGIFQEGTPPPIEQMFR